MHINKLLRTTETRVLFVYNHNITVHTKNLKYYNYSTMDIKSDAASETIDSLKELSQFLDIKSRLDLKATATEHILSK